ncbi:hypothetical protein D3C76_915620 [compost metagenome]
MIFRTILLTVTALKWLVWVAVTAPLFALITTASGVIFVKFTVAIPRLSVIEETVASLAVPVADHIIGALRTG